MTMQNKISHIIPLNVILTFSMAFFCTISFIGIERVTTFLSEQELQTQAMCAVIGKTAQAAIVFQDKKEASRILNSLSEVPTLLEAAIFTNDGEALARYIYPGRKAALQYKNEVPQTTNQTLSYITIHTPITLHNKTIGTIAVRSSMRPLYRSLTTFILTLLVILSITIILAARLSSLLSKQVTKPISSLAKAIQRVTQNPDYSIAVHHHGADEVKELIDGFNIMLATVRARDLELAGTVSKLRIAKQKADASNKAKTQFLANMSHEIRTPMNGVLGMAELLEHSHLSPKQLGYTRSILSSGKVLLAVINDILDTSKIEAGKMVLSRSPFNLQGVVEEVVSTFTPTAQTRGIRLYIDAPSALPETLLGDPDRVRQIMFNLIGNAMKFTSKGSVCIAISYRSLDDDTIEAEISVQDTGTGIPEDQQSSIFARFSQADGSTTRGFGGTGLGLTIVRQLLTLMKGRIELTSTPGKGSVFTCTIPFTRGPAQEQTSLPTQTTRPPLGTETAPAILLVEDNQVNQELAGEALEAIGCRVTTVANGALAVDAVREQSFDIVFMDCQMPVMDGYTAATRIREMEQLSKHPRTPIIAMTAHVLGDNKQRCLECGMDGYLQKPYSLSALRTCVTRWLPSAE